MKGIIILTGAVGYLLIDTAYPGDYRRFRRALARLGVGCGQSRFLLLTHHHDDHADFAARRAEQAGCRLIVHQKAILTLKGGESGEAAKPLNRCVNNGDFPLRGFLRGVQLSAGGENVARHCCCR